MKKRLYPAFVSLAVTFAMSTAAIDLQQESGFTFGVANASTQPFIFFISASGNTQGRGDRFQLGRLSVGSYYCGRDDYCFVEYRVSGHWRWDRVRPSRKYQFTRGPQGWRLYAIKG